METSNKSNLPIPVLIVLYDFRYMWKDNREIAVKKGEKLFLLEKTNRDWWQVVRPTERKSFFVPAQYVELLSKRKHERDDSGGESFSGFLGPGDDSVLYENLDSLKEKSTAVPGSLSKMCRADFIGSKVEGGKCPPETNPQKPVPKMRTKVTGSKGGFAENNGGSNDEVSEKLDSKRSFTSRISNSSDKVDNVNLADKIKQDLMISSHPPKENTFSSHDGGRSYRSVKSVVGSVAVENLVYSKVPIVSTNAGNKSEVTRQKVKTANYPNKINMDTGKNRMKNSYNLKTKPVAANLSSDRNHQANHMTEVEKNRIRQCSSSLSKSSSASAVLKNEKLQFSQNFSKSLEKLAEEIQFEPRKLSSGSTTRSTTSSSAADNQSNRIVRGPRESLEKKAEKRGKTNDASVILDENKIQPQSRSVFSRFRRSLHHSNSFKSNNLKKASGKNSKKACELSLSWEGGLDKIQEKKENEEKPSATPLGLQRSRTFMFPERSPLSVHPANKLFSGKHRLDTAYHSQRKPDEKVTLSTFKPIFNVDVPLDTQDKKVLENARTKSKIECTDGKLAMKKEKRPEIDRPEVDSESKPSKSLMIPSPKKTVIDNVTKGYLSAGVPEFLSEYQVPEHGSEGVTLYSEPYCSNSESEDNLEEKSLAMIVNKSLRSQSSIDSNLTVSEGTEASESDENSLEFGLDPPRQMIRQPMNKRRTSLVRNSRVESSKVRKVPARLPLTPPPDLKPMRDLGDGWGQYISKGGRSFYYNVKTREKNWKPPRKIMSGQDGPIIGSFESIYSDANRSNTSSPLIENCVHGNSLNRSNGSLSSKTNNISSSNNNSANSTFETPKIGSSATRWKEDSPDDLNRSSYNSSPVAGLSQSSGYSLNKSSRDSLNRFSPIDNIPSEEEGFELHDHVYKIEEDDIRKRRQDGGRTDDGSGERTSKESLDGSTFRIKPGWEEFYDENLDQIFYMYKDRKERVRFFCGNLRMCTKKINCIPPYVSLWLQSIRHATEDYEEVRRAEGPECERNSGVHASTISLYDNVDKLDSDTAGDVEKAHETLEDTCVDGGFPTWPLSRFRSFYDNRSMKNMAEYLMKEDNETGPKLWYRLKDCKNQIICINWLRNQLTVMRRGLDSYDALAAPPANSIAATKEAFIRGRKEETSGQSDAFAFMSNLLASYRKRNTQESIWNWLNESAREKRPETLISSHKDLFGEILNCPRHDLIYLEKRLSETMRTCSNDPFENEYNYFESKSGKNLPFHFGRSTLDVRSGGWLAGKPPVPPKRRKRIRMNQKSRLAGVRHWRKANFSKVKGSWAKTGQSKTKESEHGVGKTFSECELSPEKSLVENDDGDRVDDEVRDKAIAAKPLPFPMMFNPELEYELNELLMMQRVTESSKTRRRMPSRTPFLDESADGNEICIKDIPKVSPVRENRSSGAMAASVEMDDLMVKLSEENVGDLEARNKVKNFILSKFGGGDKFERDAEPTVRLREDVIIDWENDYENLNEPVVLEGKSLLSKHLWLRRFRRNRPSESESVQETSIEDCDGCKDYSKASSTNGRDACASLDSESVESTSLRESDSEIGCKTWTSSVGDGPNDFSDLDAELTETTTAGDTERGRNVSTVSISWNSSENSTFRSDITPKLYTSVLEYTISSNSNKTEDELATLSGFEDKSDETGCSVRSSFDKTASEANLTITSKSLENRSFSTNFFTDSLEEDRSWWKVKAKKRDSVTSDVCNWMAYIRGIEFPEDRLFPGDNEWILSFDSEERAYFFEETSKKSLWALPDYSNESSKPEFSFPIQRSATESAITNESGVAKLRLSKDGDKGSRISGSARSSKTQSMLIEPKFDVSANNGSKTYSMPRDLSKIYGEILHVGILNKTKIVENGKKLRKNWTPSFVVLTESYLFFFKDAKSFQNMKNVVSPSSNHMCLSLQGAVIDKGDKISSRKNVYKISCSDNTDVLIQTEKTSEAEDWFREISSVIQNLPQEPNTANSSPLLDLSSPSKVGRTKSLKVRNKESGSMEDLSSTPEDRQNKIKAKLKKFFIRRPTVDSLKKKGIWKDEPVFGCSLEQITKNRNPRVPIFVEKCIECIESKEENMKTDGLYRASGNLSQVQKIRLEVDQNNLNIMRDEEDVHVLTGSLKLFFRELKEPLIPSKQLEPALLATDKQVRKERIKDFQKIVKNLPAPNHDTLKFLLQHLLRVKEYHKYNRMNINNLAIVFGPTLMWPEQESANMALELMQQNVVIECLLKEFNEIFT